MANFESASKPALGQAKEESGEDEATDDSSDNSSDLEIHTQEEDDQTRFGMYFGAATEVQSKASSSKSGSKTVTDLVQPKAKLNRPADRPANGLRRANRPDKGEGVGSSNPIKPLVDIGLVHMDGRSERIARTVREHVSKTELYLSKELGFDEDFDGLVLTGDAEKKFLTALCQKASAVKSHEKGLKDALERMNRSRGAVEDDLKTKVCKLVETL
jgi:hypothetical protein